MGNLLSSNYVYIYRGEGSIPRNVRKVEVHRSVKFIRDRLFMDCLQLEIVLLHEGLLGIGRHAFRCCSSLRSIKIPSTVTEIGEGAFFYCSNLAAVELPEGLESIEAWTFCNCTSLVEVRIPASVTRIGESAFCGCTNLASADLRQGLRMIGDQAFQRCRSLGSLRVPLSVDEIGVMAFDGCGSLSLVQLHEDLPKMKRFAFRGCLPDSFRFVRLSERREAISMDEQKASMFERRLNEITNTITRNHGYDHDSLRVADAIWGKSKKSLERAHEFLNYLELEGAMPILEMTLWKAKIEDSREGRLRGDFADDEDGGGDAKDEARARKMRRGNQPSRKDCRVKCGAGIVSSEVRKFFAYKTNWPVLDDSE